LIPTRGLELSIAGVYMDSRYTRFMTLDPATLNPLDLSSSPFLGAGKWKFVSRGSYRLPLNYAIGDFTLDASYAWQSRVYTDTAKAHPVDASYTPAFGNLDASISWRNIMEHDGLDATIFGNNLTNNMWAIGGFLGYNSVGVRSYLLAQQRTYGIHLRYSF
jgi:hypothetical protein